MPGGWPPRERYLEGAMEGPVTNAARNTLITSLLLTCAAAVGFTQTLLDTTVVHGIGAKSCGNTCQQFPIMRPAPA